MSTVQLVDIVNGSDVAPTIAPLTFDYTCVDSKLLFVELRYEKRCQAHEKARRNKDDHNYEIYQSKPIANLLLIRPLQQTY